MEYRPFIPFSSVLFVLLLLCSIIVEISCQDGDPEYSAILTKCPDFEDLRNLPARDFQVPANLSSHGEVHDTPLHFTLDEPSPKNLLKCSQKESYIYNVSWSEGLMSGSPAEHGIHHSPTWRRNYTDMTTWNISLPTHFTIDGTFFAEKHYYRPNEYCVKSISDSEPQIKIRVCPGNCHNGTAGNNNRGVLCLPKCCAHDEYLLYFKKTCVKLDPTVGEMTWKPKIFVDGTVDEVDTTPIQFYETELPSTCNKGTPGLEEGGVDMWSPVDVKHPISDEFSQSRSFIRLVSSSEDGKVSVSLLHVSERTWKTEKDVPFCVDGFFVKPRGSNALYLGDSEKYVTYHCGLDPDGLDGTAKAGQSLVYVIISIIASLFLLATFLTYLVLWEKQNLHGLTILSFSAAQWGSYVTLIVAHIVFLSPANWTGILNRGWFCYTIAVVAHYFYMASYSWLTLMNLDLWLTFRTLRMVRKNPKDLKRFAFYSLAAWGLPVFLIAAFVAVNESYLDPETLVPIPAYAELTCFVAPEFRGYYLYIPMTIFILFNFILIFITMKIFHDARNQNRTTFGGGNDSNSNAGKYSAILFIKLFVLMGGTSIIDFLTWYYNQKNFKPWIIVVLECVAYLNPVLLFIFLCLNNRTLNQLRDKYPKVAERVSLLLPLNKGKESGGSADHSAGAGATRTSKIHSTSGSDESSHSQSTGVWNEMKSFARSSFQKRQGPNYSSTSSESKQ